MRQTPPVRSALAAAAVSVGVLVALTGCASTAPPQAGGRTGGTTTVPTTPATALPTAPDPLSSESPAPFGSLSSTVPSSTVSSSTVSSSAAPSSPAPTSAAPSVTASSTATSPSLKNGRCRPTAAAWSTGPNAADRTVALTFDDGPGRDTAAVLDVLAREKVHATFFDIGAHAAIQPDLVRREVAEGHQVGGHSWDHRYPWVVPGGWTYAFVDGQMRDTVGYLRKLTGQSVCFYRPPGGIMTNMTAAAHAEGMQLTLWTVDPKDWAHPQQGYAYSADARGIFARATLPGAVRHPIVLMHDGNGPRGATVAALPHVIDWYRSHGYRFVRLDGRG